MKKAHSLLVSTIFFLNVLIGQSSQLEIANKYLSDRNEVYFGFTIEQNTETRENLNTLNSIISIDRLEDNYVYAYANKKEFDNFLTFNINFQVFTPPSMLRQPKMVESGEALRAGNWNAYPSYDGYIDMMNQFVTDYPNLCELVNIKTLESGREILFIHINNNLGSDENEPEFMYTSSMHGDELTGYVLMLRYIDYLLENYGVNSRITNLVNNIDIWINPLANPDGTFAGGNNSVYGATRGNANGIDFNRNFPDPQDGPHPDGNEHQPETLAFIDFAEEQDLVMSCNIHGGAEVCNYPWDTWPRLHADDDWWYYVCRQYADTVHAYATSGYLTDLNNGITNGYAWYSINGGRADNINYFHNGREFILEITSQKTPPSYQLPDFWEYNYRSFLNYMEQVLFGIHGVVTNEITGDAIRAKVTVLDHDKDNSYVFSTIPAGNYHRPIKSGSYDLRFSAFGFYSKTFYDVSVSDGATTILNVELESNVLTSQFYASDTLVDTTKPVNFYDASYGDSIVGWEWTFDGGEPYESTDQNPEGITYLETGKYNVTLTVTALSGSTATTVKEGYIRVAETFYMHDTTVYLCEGVFFDAGGPEENYTDDEDYTMTFVSLLESGMLEVTFTEFELEDETDCNFDFLEIYDGSDTNAPLIGKWCGTNSPGRIVASNIEGALTFKFHSNDINNYTGWKAELSCDTGVDIPEFDIPAISLFPNPARDKINMLSPVQVDLVVIYDISGKEVYRSDQSFKSTEINLFGMSNGIYIVNFIGDRFNIKDKLIIY